LAALIAQAQLDLSRADDRWFRADGQDVELELFGSCFAPAASREWQHDDQHCEEERTSSEESLHLDPLSTRRQASLRGRAHDAAVVVRA
jgi:hypothetical protein